MSGIGDRWICHTQRSQIQTVDSQYIEAVPIEKRKKEEEQGREKTGKERANATGRAGQIGR